MDLQQAIAFLKGQLDNGGIPGPKGDKGDPGQDSTVPGPAGIDGQEVEFQKSATHIQWRYVGGVSWTNLVALTEIKGDQGIQGIQGNPGPNLTTSAFGYTTGAGGTVTQLTNKGTGVTLNKLSGQITTSNAALAAGAEISFIVTNNQVAATDCPCVAHASGGTAGAYDVFVTTVSAGSFRITISNMSAGSLSEAIVINFVVIKGASS